MKVCPTCHRNNNDDANYCAYCGGRFISDSKSDDEAAQTTQRPSFNIFWLSLLLSLALSMVMIFVLHWPVFVMGLFLPFIWQLRPRGKGS